LRLRGAPIFMGKEAGLLSKGVFYDNDSDLWRVLFDNV
jgi:hypothetical protein